jgi:hypothetical protein
LRRLAALRVCSARRAGQDHGQNNSGDGSRRHEGHRRQQAAFARITFARIIKGLPYHVQP